jgi:hypothetical protein
VTDRCDRHGEVSSRWVCTKCVKESLSDAERLRDEFSRALAEVGADCERLRERNQALVDLGDLQEQELKRLREALEYALGYIDDHPDNPRGKIRAALDRDECICDLSEGIGPDPACSCCPVHTPQGARRAALDHSCNESRENEALDREGECKCEWTAGTNLMPGTTNTPAPSRITKDACPIHALDREGEE